MPSRKKAPTSLAAHRANGDTALLIIDMISDWEFPDAAALLRTSARIAPRIAALKLRCRRAAVPVIYANDNRGQWRSDFRRVVAEAVQAGGQAGRIVAQIAPDDDDYFVLKPKHSAFFATPMDLLLQHLNVRRLLLTGVSADQCVVTTAVDARMRDYAVVVPQDCVASQTTARHRRALAHFEEVLDIRTTPSDRLRLPRVSGARR